MTRRRRETTEELKNKDLERTREEATKQNIVRTVVHNNEQRQMGRSRKVQTARTEEECTAKRPRREEDKESEEDEDNDEIKKDKDDDKKSVLAPDGVSKYIIRGYKPEMSGKDIPKERVVKAENGRFFQETARFNEPLDFWKKSTLACPTYGICIECFGSGPVGLHCQKCRGDNVTTLIVDQEDMFYGSTKES